MGLNELVLVGTGFVLARVLYVWYSTPANARKPVDDPRRERGPR
jgi:hypothetical protein